MSAISAVVIEDSRLYQAYLRRVLEADGQIRICGMAASAAEARALLAREQPDVITLDLHLPDMEDFQLLRELVGPDRPPVIVVTSAPEACQQAIALGAKDFLEKVQGADMTPEQFALLLRLKIKTQAVLAHRPPPPPREAATAARPAPSGPVPRDRLIAIGASLGGTETTLEILRALPARMPGMVIVQHMPEGFTRAYAMRLDRNCALTVREARDRDRAEPGLALVAPGRQQTRVVPSGDGGFLVRCTREAPEGGFCPSVDVLFASVARAAGDRAAGVILTGLGRDGARGLLEMRRAGARTLGQSADSCAVYGMPAAARALGAVQEELSPAAIAQRLIGIAAGS